MYAFSITFLILQLSNKLVVFFYLNCQWNKNMPKVELICVILMKIRVYIAIFMDIIKGILLRMRFQLFRGSCKTNFYFFFSSCLRFGVIPKNPLSNSRSQTFTLMFSCMNFVVQALMFNPSIYLELIFGYGSCFHYFFLLSLFCLQQYKNQICLRQIA